MNRRKNDVEFIDNAESDEVDVEDEDEEAGPSSSRHDDEDVEAGPLSSRHDEEAGSSSSRQFTYDISAEDLMGSDSDYDY